jgi:hypothetical protein
MYQLWGEVVHVHGGSEGAIVQRIVRQNYGRVRDCAQQAFPHPAEGPLGEWTMTLEITPGGRIAGVRTEPAAPLKFAKCLRAAFTQATIGFPKERERTVVDYRWRIAWGRAERPAEPCEN